MIIRNKYEKKHQPLASNTIFYRRVLWNMCISFIILFLCLMIGVAGYHYLAEANWIDAFHNASMILSGMGPVIEIKSYSGKWFSSLYALFSGIVFITNIGIILAPAIHRLFHVLHVED